MVCFLIMFSAWFLQQLGAEALAFEKQDCLFAGQNPGMFTSLSSLLCLGSACGNMELRFAPLALGDLLASAERQSMHRG